ncbi:sigma-70 family RNA polymerase sigma factor [Pedobacter sp. HDW13]|uniref:sigma-70 family RNA polymerase sigma factor n=1 Tax=Pedobacter sp. HDW13 TaxID=2714940 RepID=UPI0014078D50|nr:sigma-70 family RNA polymerase sigma factor [Pedobacter sp. HDW13]QIL37918.1 sigma-70 family RNA polymerase sigma factor [Pedobacter sp. HDW13]
MIDWEKVEDSVLIQGLKEGSRPAFNAIYSRYSDTLFRFGLNILKDQDECMDAVQDIFIWLWENRRKLNISNLKGYLMAAVKFKLTRVIVSSKRRDEILAGSIKTDLVYDDDNLEIKELRNAIAEFVLILPPKAREIYQMSRGEYLSNKEIAARLGISEKTVEAQITISLKKLKVFLGKMSFWIVFL